MTSYRRFALAVASVCAAVFVAHGAAHAAGGAFAVDDSDIGKPGECKVESWAAFADNGDFIGLASPACVINHIRPVELGFSVARFRSDGEWGTELVLKGKTNLMPSGVGKVGVGLGGAVAIDLLTGEFSGALINVPVTFQITEEYKINLNAGWLYTRSDDVHWFTWGGGFEWIFIKQWTLIGEVFGLAGPKDPAQPSQTDPRAQVGLRYTPMEYVDFDFIYGRNITGENANWFTVGVNLRFGGG